MKISTLVRKYGLSNSFESDVEDYGFMQALLLTFLMRKARSVVERVRHDIVPKSNGDRAYALVQSLKEPSDLTGLGGLLIVVASAIAIAFSHSSPGMPAMCALSAMSGCSATLHTLSLHEALGHNRLPEGAPSFGDASIFANVP